MVGMSHWMAPCHDIRVIRAMLSRSGGFDASLNAFAVLKERLCQENMVPPLRPSPYSSTDSSASAVLASMLPDRSVCEEWIERFYCGYGRIYPIIDLSTAAVAISLVFSDTQRAQPDGLIAFNTIFLLRAVLVVSLAMQTSEAHRLHGRRLGRLVEHFFLSASRVQKPCVGFVQILLLLVLLRTVISSDTDDEHDMASLMGLTAHITSVIGLHRDPALLPDMSPYYAEQRKRLWAYFLQLNLTYCVRGGKQLALRLEYSDCPLPTPTVLQAPTSALTVAPDLDTERLMARHTPNDEQECNDAVFGYAMAATARIIAPVYQALCSSNPLISTEQQAEIRSAFSAVVAGLPPGLQPDAATSDPMQVMQRTLLSVSMHSFLLILSLSALQGSESLTAADGSAPRAHVLSEQRLLLLEIWDYAISVLGQFQSICQPDNTRQADGSFDIRNTTDSSSAASTATATADAHNAVFHMLWPDASRAALAACLVIGRLRRLDEDRDMPFTALTQQHSASVFQLLLVQALCFLSRIFRSKSHLGPVTAEIGLLLSVTSAVANNLHLDSGDILDQGVAAADQAIADLSADLDQRRSLVELLDRSASAIEPVRDGSLSLSAMYEWTPATFENGQQAEVPNSSSSSYIATPDFITRGDAPNGERDGALGLDLTSINYSFSIPPECSVVIGPEPSFVSMGGECVMGIF